MCFRHDKPSPVVTNGEMQFEVSLKQLHINIAGVGVPNCIRDRFLCDSKTGGRQIR